MNKTNDTRISDYNQNESPRLESNEGFDLGLFGNYKGKPTGIVELWLGILHWNRS